MKRQRTIHESADIEMLFAGWAHRYRQQAEAGGMESLRVFFVIADVPGGSSLQVDDGDILDRQIALMGELVRILAMRISLDALKIFLRLQTVDSVMPPPPLIIVMAGPDDTRLVINAGTFEDIPWVDAVHCVHATGVYVFTPREPELVSGIRQTVMRSVHQAFSLADSSVRKIAMVSMGVEHLVYFNVEFRE